MMTATAERPETSDEAVSADELRDEAAKAEQAAEQLAARIRDLLPDLTLDTVDVMEWTPEARQAVAKLMDEPPRDMADSAEAARLSMGDEAHDRLIFAALCRKLDNAMKRDDRVRKAERAAAKARHNVVLRSSVLKQAKKDLDGAEAQLDAALYSLQVAVTDKGNRQNALPLLDAEEGDAAPADPAATAPIADLNLSSALTEKLVEAGIKRVAEAVDWRGSDSPRKVAGIGKAAEEKIDEALMDWRERNPVAEN